MASKRIDGPTPNGGAYSIGVYVNLEEWREVNDLAEATGLVITEFDSEGRQIFETVGRIAEAEIGGIWTGVGR